MIVRGSAIRNTFCNPLDFTCDKIFLRIREIFKFKKVKAAPIIPPIAPTIAAGITAIILRSSLLVTCDIEKNY